MKKIIAALLCTLLAFSGVATAETVTLKDDIATLDINLTLPEGAEMTMNEVDGDITMAMVAKSGAAEVFVSVAPNKDFGERPLEDLSDDEVAKLLEPSYSYFSEPVTKKDVMPNGETYICISQYTGKSLATVMTFSHGYIVELVQNYKDFLPLSDTDIEFMMNVLYGLELVEVEK